ncbi:hypothetical protein ID866_12992 [Astraeus odoratus]
MYPG